MSAREGDVTTLLNLASAGDAQAQEELFRRVEASLRKKAEGCLNREQSGHLLQTTLLVDDVFLKLVVDHCTHWQDRSQFYRRAATVMRRHLVNYARERLAQKRGGGLRPVDLDRVPELADRKSLDPLILLAIDEALNRLAVTRPELSKVVELHLIGGWTLKEIAEDILHLSQETVKHRWQKAKAYLRREMNGVGYDVRAAPARRKAV